MRLTFRIRYHTNFGQSLLLTGDHDMFGNGDIARAIPLHYVDEQFWEVTIVIPNAAVPNATLTYNYVLRNPDGSLIYDWGRDKRINPASFKKEEVLVIDSWNHAGAFENPFYTEPFKKVLLKRDIDHVTPAFLSAAEQTAPCTHTFRVKTPLLAPNQALCILGSGSALQNWNTTRPAQLYRNADDEYFTVHLDLSRQAFPVEYKYGVYDLETPRSIRFEDGPNRVLSDSVAPHKQTIVNDGFVAFPCTTWKGAGVAIPVFSLRSDNSFGVGEFADLKLLADWCKQAGLKLIQILPINDTIATHTWLDSYPYAAISAFALHPLYLNLAQVASAQNKRLLEKLEHERKRLDSLEAVDYEAVLNSKLDFLKQIYPSQKSATFNSSGYQEFFEQNQHWLVPYAAFSCLRDKYGTADFSKWPADATFNAQAIANDFAEREIVSSLSPGERAGVRGNEISESQDVLDSSNEAADELAFPDVSFYYFLQYHLHRQLKEATEYIHSQGIILKGDIAIGVSRFGADVWQAPDLFHMEYQAGAPPDAFGIKGQNWGFPTYNWPRMKETGFAWWKQRFEQMGRYFDAFRIDHILGFFRIWSVPIHAVEGILGFFVPAIPVHYREFQNRGIPFDRNRYVEPFITEHILKEVFGDSSEFIKSHFLQPDDHGRYKFKLQFSTQRQIEAQFDSWERSEHNEKLKLGLFDLISNILLFEVQGSNGEQLHFRFGIENSSSFKNLPHDVQARLKDLYIDYFFRRQDDFWLKEAMQKLPALKRVTNMLVCGEDLGLVPACVPRVMKDLGLLSLEIQRMPKRLGHEFFNPKDAPYLSVVTPSTHDMSTIRGWWEEDRTVTQKFYNWELGRHGAPPSKCGPPLVESIILQHLNSPAMWSIFQIQDLFGMDEQLRRSDPAAERINVPANPKNYWRYRMHLNLETLLNSHESTNCIRQLVQQSGR
jgi:4-alpha-glucanotransferase